MAQTTYSCLDVLTDSLIEACIIAPGETPDGETVQWAFRKFNYRIDVWQALQFYVFGYQFNLYTYVPGLLPHTIGPDGTTPAATFSTGDQPRPTRLESAATVINPAGTLVDSPILRIRDNAWWAANQTKEIQTSIPTDVYYDPLSPLGFLYFWPVPNIANQVRLQFWACLSQFESINDPIGGPGGPGTLPQANRAALMLTLAEDLLPGTQLELHPVLQKKALEARAAVFGNNAKSPRMKTQDWGMPRAGRRAGTKGDFNWETGGRPGGPGE